MYCSDMLLIVHRIKYSGSDKQWWNQMKLIPLLWRCQCMISGCCAFRAAISTIGRVSSNSGTLFRRQTGECLSLTPPDWPKLRPRPKCSALQYDAGKWDVDANIASGGGDVLNVCVWDLGLTTPTGQYRGSATPVTGYQPDGTMFTVYQRVT